MTPGDYTLHSVAFPTLDLQKDWWTDELLIGGEGGEAAVAFMELDGKPAVRVSFFLESMDLAYRLMPILWNFTDETTPAEIIARLEAKGWTASAHHTRGQS